MKIYLDACYIIYLLEGSGEFQNKAKLTLLKYSDEKPIVYSSLLSKLECLIKPMRESHSETIEIYRKFFSTRGFEFIPISEEIIDSATSIRGKYNFKTPDAIHLVSAITIGADIFLTGDEKLKLCHEVNIESF
ncbi:MAG: type II toxin-antitoxin system VapC family toxin [Leptospiraceae bacterium]|nr:type II toxin-antitoxin system VapC family toxin [Leptospiraceae bacterium]